MESKILKTLRIFSTFLFSCAFLKGSPDLLQKIEQLGSLTDAPQVHSAKGSKSSDNPRAIFFDALPWKGKSTRSYGWLGMPKSTGSKVPAVVLVHGGGGSAFKEWVVRWNEQGFAAISIAVEGQTDQKVENDEGKKIWQRHPWAGPQRVGIFGDSDQALADQWMYHAVSQTILAHSLIRSLPEVDPSKVGLMGVSWGGIITSIVMGIDSRFSFAIPVYGCGYLNEADNHYKGALASNPVYLNGWEAGQRLDRAKMPALWFSWPGDKHFPMEILKKSYLQQAGPNLVSLVPNMGHGHRPAWTRPESYAFAREIVTTGKLWCERLSSGVIGKQAYARFSSDRPLKEATLVHSTEKGVTGKRKWIQTPIRLVKQGTIWRADWPLPAGTTGWFINVEADGLIASSDYHERESP